MHSPRKRGRFDSGAGEYGGRLSRAGDALEGAGAQRYPGGAGKPATSQREPSPGDRADVSGPGADDVTRYRRALDVRARASIAALDDALAVGMDDALAVGIDDASPEYSGDAWPKDAEDTWRKT